MKKLAKLLALVLVLALVLSMFAGCKNENNDETKPPETKGNNEDTKKPDESVPPETEPVEPTEYQGYISELDADGNYVRADDEEIFESVYGEFAELMAKARDAASNDERFVIEAQAEAVLLDTATMIPNTTKGGAYTISRIAPRSKPYVQWGNDDDRWHSLVISDEFLTPAERNELLDMWNKAVAGEGTYDPAAYLTGKGHTLQTDYTYSFSTAPVTLDWLNTSSQSDTEITVQCVDGLVEYDVLSTLQPKLAESWEISDDGLTYTFHIRHGVKWYTAEGTEYAELTANDFVAGFHHMMDTKAGLEGLVAEGGAEIAGAKEYLYEGGSFDNVGYKAADDYTLVITLNKPVPFFMTMLTYSIFLPICQSFYEANGGVYGAEEYAQRDDSTYKFGLNTDVSSQVYCGPFLLQKLQPDSEILVVKNPNYYDADKVTLNSIKWVYDDGSNPDAVYNDCVNGIYAGVTLGKATGLLDKAIEDGNFDKYAYISETESVTYFGGLNLNRGTFALESGACTSPKTEQEKADTVTALNNKNFRKAMQHAFDKKTQNAVSRGEELAETNLRNMYTHPEFVKLEGDFTDENGHTFPAGSMFGDLVQYYCDQLGCKINVKDGVDGWYNAAAAKEYLEKAKEELGDKVTWPIKIDVVYYSPSDSNTAQANAYKASIENTLGAENVVVNLVEASEQADFYACGYRARSGEAGNFDMFYGSGWGPDYGDPCTYLNTFDYNVDGYMLKVVGLF